MITLSSYRLVRDAHADASWPGKRLPELSSPVRIHKLMYPFAAIEDTETVWVLPLNSNKRMVSLGPITVARGGRVGVEVDVVKVLQAAVHYAAHGIILVHNHPGGLAEPSAADDELTARVYAGATTLEIEFLDHVIIAGRHYYSHAETLELKHRLTNV